MPKMKVMGQTVQTGELGQTDRQTNKQTDTIKTYYIPCFVVDNHWINRVIPCFMGCIGKSLFNKWTFLHMKCHWMNWIIEWKIILLNKVFPVQLQGDGVSWLIQWFLRVHTSVNWIPDRNPGCCQTHTHLDLNTLYSDGELEKKTVSASH